ncbi:MAG: tetratricopeptide repeat protein [Syntrophorhabdaceae bacterium]
MGKQSKTGGERNDDLAAENPEAASGMAAFIVKPVVHISLVILIGLIVYSNTFAVPFLFDDNTSIYKNIAVNPEYYVKTPVSGIFSSPRPVGQLTFALNHAVHGLNVAGYHAVNLLIHLSCALLVYWLVALLCRLPHFAGCLRGSVDLASPVQGFVALFAALLFVSHPVQTQSVTYIVQRYVSLATLFYLLSLVMYIRFRLSESSGARYLFYALSFLSAVLAMKTKEIAFTLPVMMMLCEFMFFRGDARRRLLSLIPLILTMTIIPLSLLITQGSSPEGAVMMDQLTRGASLNTISPGDYLNTQFRVIVTYIRLLFLPINQNLDYDYPIYKTFFHPQVFISFLFLLIIFVWGVYLTYRSGRGCNGEKGWYRLAAFGIFWFFVTLSVESSIIPIADVIFEHRLYLPSVGFFMAILSGIAWLKGRMGGRSLINKAAWTVMMLLVAGLSVTAYARNTVWQNGVTLWEDVMTKSPEKTRANYNLGLLYSQQGRIDEAISRYQTAIALSPGFYRPYNDLGNAYFNQGRLDDALKQYQQTLALKPDYAEPHNNIGIVYVKKGRYSEAIGEFLMALKLKPDYADAHVNLGNVYFEQGLTDKAVQHYQNALLINPDNKMARNNLKRLITK